MKLIIVKRSLLWLCAAALLMIGAIRIPPLPAGQAALGIIFERRVALGHSVYLIDEGRHDVMGSPPQPASHKDALIA